MDTVERIKSSKSKLSDEELTRMAMEELNREMVKAKARAEISPGTLHARCPLKKANKRFLNNTLRNALNFNKRKGQSTRIKSMKRLVEVEERVENPQSAGKPQKFGDRQHVFKKRRKSPPPPKKSSFSAPAKLSCPVVEVDSSSSSSSTSDGDNCTSSSSSDDDVIVLD